MAAPALRKVLSMGLGISPALVLTPPRNCPAVCVLVPNQEEMRHQWDESLQGTRYLWIELSRRVPPPT